MAIKTMQRFTEAKKILKVMEKCETIPIKSSQMTAQGRFTTLDASKLNEFITYLSSFLSSGRSITWVLQKEYSRVDGFKKWYEKEQEVMRCDKLMERIKDLRNKSEKEGSIQPNLVISLNLPTSKSKAQHFFEDKEKNTIVDLCKEYLNKIEKLIKKVEDKFGAGI